jgi:hypothetical protein
MLDYYENEIRPYLACLPSRLDSILPETSFPPRRSTFLAAVLHDVMTVVLSGSSLKDDLRLAASGTCGAARILGEFVLTRGWLQVSVTSPRNACRTEEAIELQTRAIIVCSGRSGAYL